MIFSELPCMALDSFSKGESMCFHCWLWRLLSCSKWWHYISSSVTIWDRKWYSSWYFFRRCSNVDILFNFCSTTKLRGTHCTLIFQNFRCSVKVAWIIPWVMPNMSQMSSVVHHHFFLMTVSTAAMTEGVNDMMNLSWLTHVFQWHLTFFILFIPLNHMHTWHTVFATHSRHLGMNFTSWYPFCFKKVYYSILFLFSGLYIDVGWTQDSLTSLRPHLPDKWHSDEC